MRKCLRILEMGKETGNSAKIHKNMAGGQGYEFSQAHLETESENTCSSTTSVNPQAPSRHCQRCPSEF
jgi:hypothetical protein